MIARPRALSLRDKTFASQETASPGTGVPSNLGWPCEARGLSFPGPWKSTISLLQSVSREGCADWILECSNFFPVENVYPGGEAPWDSGNKQHTPFRESEIYQKHKAPPSPRLRKREGWAAAEFTRGATRQWGLGQSLESSRLQRPWSRHQPGTQ